jgi:hypothetical protein
MTRVTLLLFTSIASFHALNAQAASGPRVGLTNIGLSRVDVGLSTRGPARLSFDWHSPPIDPAARREVKNSDAPLLGALIGVLVGAVSFRLLADDHVDNPGNYTMFGVVLGGGLGLLIGLSWKSMHQLRMLRNHRRNAESSHSRWSAEQLKGG